MNLILNFLNLNHKSYMKKLWVVRGDVYKSEKKFLKAISYCGDGQKYQILTLSEEGVLSNLKSRTKASMAEFNTNPQRTGVRGGKQTTLSANSYNTARMYDANLEDLKTLVKYL